MFMHKIFHWQTSTDMSTVFISQWRDLSRGVVKGDILKVFFFFFYWSDFFSLIGLWMKDFPISRYLCGEGNDNPLQYSCQDDPMDRRAWRATVHGVTKSRTQLSYWAHTDIYEMRDLPMGIINGAMPVEYLGIRR